jgi:hypothetical protein
MNRPFLDLICNSLYPNDCLVKKNKGIIDVQRIILAPTSPCFCIGLTTGESFEANLNLSESVYSASNHLHMIYIIGLHSEDFLNLVNSKNTQFLLLKNQVDPAKPKNKEKTYQTERIYCFLSHYPFLNLLDECLQFIVSTLLNFSNWAFF